MAYLFDENTIFVSFTLHTSHSGGVGGVDSPEPLTDVSSPGCVRLSPCHNANDLSNKVRKN